MNGVQIARCEQVMKSFSKFKAIVEIYGSRTVAKKCGISAATVQRMNSRGGANFTTLMKMIKFVEQFEKNEKRLAPAESRPSELFPS